MGRKARRGRKDQRPANEERRSMHRPHHRRDGQPKTSYHSETEALIVAEEIGFDAVAYVCQECHAWHLANDNGEY